MIKFSLQLTSLVFTLGMLSDVFSCIMPCFVWLTSIYTPYQRISTVSEKSVFPQKACSDVSRFILSRIFSSDLKPTALSDVYRLFTTIVYLAIQVACFDAIFDCITNMIGRLFNLHIVKSTPNNQTWKRRGFLDLYSDVNVTFYVFISFHLVA